jgi:hypothetical protein
MAGVISAGERAKIIWGRTGARLAGKDQPRAVPVVTDGAHSTAQYLVGCPVLAPFLLAKAYVNVSCNRVAEL